MILQINTTNYRGNDVVSGYCNILVPTQPGRHEIITEAYAPRSSSMWQELVNLVSGKTPEYINPEFITRSEGREVTRVRSSGIKVKIIFNVCIKELEEFGFDVGKKEF